jgi:hypothetical protein
MAAELLKNAGFSTSSVALKELRRCIREVDPDGLEDLMGVFPPPGKVCKDAAVCMIEAGSHQLLTALYTGWSPDAEDFTQQTATAHRLAQAFAVCPFDAWRPVFRTVYHYGVLGLSDRNIFCAGVMRVAAERGYFLYARDALDLCTSLTLEVLVDVCSKLSTRVVTTELLKDFLEQGRRLTMWSLYSARRVLPPLCKSGRFALLDDLLREETDGSTNLFLAALEERDPVTLSYAWSKVERIRRWPGDQHTLTSALITWASHNAHLDWEHADKLEGCVYRWIRSPKETEQMWRQSLYRACRQGDHALVYRFVHSPDDAPAPIREMDETQKRTALEAACEEGEIDVVAVWLSRYGDMVPLRTLARAMGQLLAHGHAQKALQLLSSIEGKKLDERPEEALLDERISEIDENAAKKMTPQEKVVNAVLYAQFHGLLEKCKDSEALRELLHAVLPMLKRSLIVNRSTIRLLHERHRLLGDEVVLNSLGAEKTAEVKNALVHSGAYPQVVFDMIDSERLGWHASLTALPALAYTGADPERLVTTPIWKRLESVQQAWGGIDCVGTLHRCAAELLAWGDHARAARLLRLPLSSVKCSGCKRAREAHQPTAARVTSVWTLLSVGKPTSRRAPSYQEALASWSVLAAGQIPPCTVQEAVEPCMASLIYYGAYTGSLEPSLPLTPVVWHRCVTAAITWFHAEQKAGIVMDKSHRRAFARSIGQVPQKEQWVYAGRRWIEDGNIDLYTWAVEASLEASNLDQRDVLHTWLSSCYTIDYPAEKEARGRGRSYVWTKIIKAMESLLASADDSLRLLVQEQCCRAVQLTFYQKPSLIFFGFWAWYTLGKGHPENGEMAKLNDVTVTEAIKQGRPGWIRALARVSNSTVMVSRTFLLLGIVKKDGTTDLHGAARSLRALLGVRTVYPVLHMDCTMYFSGSKQGERMKLLHSHNQDLDVDLAIELTMRRLGEGASLTVCPKTKVEEGVAAVCLSNALEMAYTTTLPQDVIVRIIGTLFQSRVPELKEKVSKKRNAWLLGAITRNLSKRPV